MRRKSHNERLIEKKKLDELNIRKIKFDKGEKEKKMKLDNYRKKLEEKQEEKIRKEAMKQLSEQKKKRRRRNPKKIKIRNSRKKRKGNKG